jgi:hypothetical protein
LHPRSALSFSASLAAGEAVLRFPYDEHLRQLLRAIPGRRWDPQGRAWCVPLDSERAEALARLFANLPGEPEVSDALARAMKRRRARRRRDECLLDLARPDSNWWLGFATDGAPAIVAALLEHPGAHSLPAIGRALIPIDDHAARLIDELDTTTTGLRLSDAARRALFVNGEDAGSEDAPAFTSPPERTRGWRGSIEVDGPSEQPVFRLVGADGRAARRLDERRRETLRGRAEGRPPGAARGARTLGGAR